uniref:SAP domain-containing protein n=1 Tax=Pavo cristatus TaxID=9049 RepID=A0A8C9EQK7_PAVCR
GEPPAGRPPAGECRACAERRLPRPGSPEPLLAPRDSLQCRVSDQETNGKNTASNPNDFSDPIYKEIAMTNGCINRMTRDELRSKLAEFKLDTRLG